MIRIALLLTVLTSQTLATFKYRHCDAQCRAKWGACMITQISENEFEENCYKDISECPADLNGMSICIDFSNDLKGNKAIWPDYEKYKKSQTGGPTPATEAGSSTAESVTTVSSYTSTSRSASTTTIPLPVTESTEMLPAVPIPHEPTVQSHDAPSNEIMLAGLGLGALVLVAIIFHLCCRQTKKRRCINEEPLKLDSDAFSGVEYEKPAQPTFDRDGEVREHHSSYL